MDWAEQVSGEHPVSLRTPSNNARAVRQFLWRGAF